MSKIEIFCNETMDELDRIYDIEPTLRNAFISVIKYLNQYPENLSVRSKKNSVNVSEKNGIRLLADLYFNAFYSPTIPKLPQTVPDEMVSLIMRNVFGYTKEQADEIKKTHLQSMASENAVGTLLERYLDSVLRPNGWAWCCGDFVRAIDFLKYDDGIWYELQIKNRSNSENSSSSAIRTGTKIHKWYRTNAKTGEAMWDFVPEPMQGLGLSEEGFKTFVEKYLKDHIN
ncbi:MAG: SinI family restriction endonuclease [Treponema sp.]